MNLNRIANMVVALVLRRFINMGISKALSLFKRQNRDPKPAPQAGSPPLPTGTPIAPRAISGADQHAGQPATPPSVASGGRTKPQLTPEARAARRARQIARRSNG
jgi:hypothetical protein